MARIYLSSTYGDLQDCRDRVYHSLRRMGHDVIAMEDYVATDQRPLEKCLSDVDSCDVYVGLFAWRYGYVPAQDNPDNLSITEREFRRAREKGRSCLLFLLHEEAAWPRLQMEQGEGGARIEALRSELHRDFTVDFFRDCEELANKVSTALHNWERDLVRPASEGLNELQRLMREPAVREAAAQFHADFSAACEQIEVVACYKDLHDQLHLLEFQCFNCLVRSEKNFPEDDTTRESLADYLLTLEAIVVELQNIARKAALPVNDVSWIEEVACAQNVLKGAIDESDRQQLKEATWILRRMLMRQPTKINQRLNDSARALRLPTLANAMSSIRDTLARLETEREKTDKLQYGIDALGELDAKLAKLRDEHDGWQDVEFELRQLDGNPNAGITEIKDAWPSLNKKAEPLCNDHQEALVLTLKEIASKLQAALDTQNEVEAKTLFRAFRRKSGDWFYRVDTDLRELCGQLRAVGHPLAAMLRIME